MKDYLKLRKEELKKRGAKGFTLMEMLIVVAIIAVLVAIAIPIFTSQLEKSREATDMANVRSAYAEAMTEYMTGKTSQYSTTVSAQQQQSGWQGEEGYINTLIDGKESKVTYSAKVVGSTYTVKISTTGNNTEVTVS